MNLSFFSVPVFSTGLLTVICPSSPLFGLFVIFSSPWSRDISFLARVYYSCLFSQTMCTVLLSQCSLHEPILWTSSLPWPGYFSTPSDWRRVPDISKICTTKLKTQKFLLGPSSTRWATCNTKVTCHLHQQE